MTKNSFYTNDELLNIGFHSIGNNVLISRKTSIYTPENIDIGNNVRIDDFTILSGKISIGNYIHIAAFSALYGSCGIELHDFVNISAKVLIYSVSDDYSGEYMTNPMIINEAKNVDGGKVIIKKHAIVGADSIIMPNIVINEGAAVGAKSFVKNNLEQWSIYVGVPAKKIKDRSKNLLKFEEKYYN